MMDRLFEARDISADSDGPTFDVIFTDVEGIKRYSDNVFHTIEDAQAAAIAYVEDVDFYPHHWDKLTEGATS